MPQQHGLTMMNPTSATTRLPKLRRAGAALRPPHRLTERDLAIIEAIFNCRVLTSAQIERLLFDGASQGERICRRRLQKLYHHEYLAREELPVKASEGSAPYLYFLDRLGAEALAQWCGVDSSAWTPKKNKVQPLFLHHRLATNDVRIAATVDARARGYALVRWVDEDALNADKETVTVTDATGKDQTVCLVPDGYFEVLVGGVVYHFFLELDRATETGVSAKWRDWAGKIGLYLAYYGTGRYQAKYQTADLRVLTVTTSRERAENLRAATVKAGGKGRFWFATLPEVMAGSFFRDPLWQAASDATPRAIIV